MANELPAGMHRLKVTDPRAKAAAEVGQQRHITGIASATNDGGSKVIVICLDDGSRVGVFKAQWDALSHVAADLFK